MKHQQKTMDRETVKQIIRDELAFLIQNDKIILSRLLQVVDGRNIQLGQGVGTKIGTASSQRLGLWGKTPVVQQGAISDASGAGAAGVDTPARTALNSLLTACRNIGIIAT